MTPSEHSHAAAAPVRASPRRFLAFCPAEPFRIFFPLGALSGVIGLGLWPLFVLGVITVYPGLMHSRIMIEGFAASFIVGFLGTAGPRLAEARSLTIRELGALLLLQLLVLAAHLSMWVAAGDALFCAELVLLVLLLLSRFSQARALPPPSFVLVGCGLLTGVLGSALLASFRFLSQWPSLYTFGSLALTQGFVLLPLLGAGAFLFPRILLAPGSQPECTSDPAWNKHAALAAGAAALLLLSFALESIDLPRLAALLRLFSVAAYLATQVPAVLVFDRKPFLAQCIRCAVWSIVAGFLWTLFFPPAYRVAGLHFLFVGGFMAVVIAVATRVILGHTGQSHLCETRRAYLITTFVLLWIGLSARIGADFMSTYPSRIHHLLWAALFCIAALLLWAIRLFPRLTIEDQDS